MNVGGVSKACKSSVIPIAILGFSGKRVSNTLVIYLRDGDSPLKNGLIPDGHEGAKAILM